MKKNLTRPLVRILGVMVATQTLFVGAAFSAPSDQQAWKDAKSGVTVYHDELDPAIFWYVPQIQFESANGKTTLRPKSLANGNTEYTTRIIPYLSESIRQQIFADLPEIQQQSQLRPVVARAIGISLPDFGFKTTSELPAGAIEAPASSEAEDPFPTRGAQTRDPEPSSVTTITNIQYIDIPKLLRFQLSPDDAALFEELLDDRYGVSVAFTLSYDGVVRNKFYQISVSCKDMYQALSQMGGVGASVAPSKAVFVGGSIEAAFKKAIQNNLGGVDIISKGELPAMDEALRSTLDYCFQPTDAYARQGYEEEDRLCRDDDGCLDRTRDDGDLMPKVAARGRFRLKKSMEKETRIASIKHVNVQDAVSTTTLMSALHRDAPADPAPLAASPSTKKLRVRTNQHSETRPWSGDLKIETGVQYTIRTTYSLWVHGKAVVISPDTPPLEDYLFYRIGFDDWKPVTKHFTIDSNIARGGALQFYVESASLRKALPLKYKYFGAIPEVEYTVQVTAKRFNRAPSTLANR